VAFSYTPELRDPVSRVRGLLEDKTEDRAHWSDEDIRLALAETEWKSFVWLHYDTTADAAATSAKVEIRIGTTTYELVLTVTTGPNAGTVTFDLSRDARYDLIHELVDGINALTPTWVVGLDSGERVVWLPRPLSGWPGTWASSAEYRDALERKSMDMALTPGALEALGVPNKRRLSLYQPKAASRRLLRQALSSLDHVDSITAGDVSLSRTNLQDRLRLLNVPVAAGVAL